jgi:hypothetical protein
MAEEVEVKEVKLTKSEFEKLTGICVVYAYNGWFEKADVEIYAAAVGRYDICIDS